MHVARRIDHVDPHSVPPPPTPPPPRPLSRTSPAPVPAPASPYLQMTPT
jgi:hypothetical protein